MPLVKTKPVRTLAHFLRILLSSTKISYSTAPNLLPEFRLNSQSGLVLARACTSYNCCPLAPLLLQLMMPMANLAMRQQRRKLVEQAIGKLSLQIQGLLAQHRLSSRPVSILAHLHRKDLPSHGTLMCPHRVNTTSAFLSPVAAISKIVHYALLSQ